MDTTDKKLLFDRRLLVELPDSFQSMDKDKIELMYPYDDKPQIILEDKDTSEFCTFSLLKEQKLAGTQVMYAIRSILNVVASLYPSSILKESALVEREKGVCGWFAFRTNGEKGELYNYMYLFPVDGSMMLGTMGCLMEDEAGKNRLLKIMESLAIPEKEHGDNVGSRGMIRGGWADEKRKLY